MNYAFGQPYCAPYSYLEWSLMCMVFFPTVEIFVCFGESSHFADVRLVG